MAVTNKDFTNIHVFKTKALYDANVSSIANTDMALVNAENGTYYLGSIVDKVLGENGYIKYDNGLIIQWGNFLESDGATDIKSFPIEFPNQCFIAMACDPGQTSNGNYQDVKYTRTAWIEPISNSKFYIGRDNEFSDHGSSGLHWYVYMVAIGN